MAQITTTTRANPLQWPSARRLERHHSTGHMFYSQLDAAGTSIQLYRSTDWGNTYSLFDTVTLQAAALELSSGIIDVGGRIYWAYRTNESSQDRLYIQASIILSDRLSNHNLLRLAAPNNGGAAGSVYHGLDVVPVRHPDGRSTVAVAAGTTQGTYHGVELFGVSVPVTGQPTLNNGLIAGNRKWLFTGSGRITPSLGLERSPTHLWVTFGRTSVWSVRCPWGGAGWTGPTIGVRQLDGIPAQEWLASVWADGAWDTVAPWPTDTTRVALIERNQANTKTTTWVAPAHPAGVVRHCTLAWDNVSRDIRVYAMGTSSNVLYHCDFIRATATWSGWTQTVATAILGSGADQYGVRRESYIRARYDVVTAHAGSPNTIVHTAQVLSYAPSAPMWRYADFGMTTNRPSSNGAAMNVSAPLDLGWTFVDADPEDTQSAWALSRQIGSGTVQYFRASDGTWQASEVKNTGTTSSRTLSAGWGVDGDPAHTYRVKVWDSADVASVYGPGLSVVPSLRVNPTITSPATDGTVITSDTVTVQWTVAEQSAYRVRLQIASQVQYDSWWRAGTATSFTPPSALVDGLNYSIKLETRNNEGLVSAEQTRNITVDYTEPAIPTLTVTPQPLLGLMRVVITNPAPTGTQPAVLGVDLYRRDEGALFDNSSMVLVATGLPSNATYDDWTVRSGKAYEYRAVARGANGTSGFSAWQP